MPNLRAYGSVHGALAASAHADTFCRDHLPPMRLWPELCWCGIPEPMYPARLNCAVELVDKQVESGLGLRNVFYSSKESWTYSQLLEKTNQLAHVLVNDFGLVPGNRVLLRGPNSPMLAACWLAVLKAGGVAVCTMSMLRVRELRQVIEKAEVSLCITDASVVEECREAIEASQGRVRMVQFNGESATCLESRMIGKPDVFTACQTAPDDVAIIAFTSGTTGHSKGTMHFHRDLIAVTECFPRWIVRPDPSDIFCGSPPLAFTYALGALLLFPLKIGASAVLLEDSSPSRLLSAIQKFRATVCFTAPTGYRAMMPQVHEFDVSSLRKCVSAGETLPVATFEAWRHATGHKIIDGIGATEMLHIFISAAGDEIRPGSTGCIVPGYQAILLGNDGNEVAVGELGRLAVRGPTGCRYLDDIDHQKEFVQRGWNLTGDTYRRDAENYFWFQARSDEMIVSAGYNIAPAEIESVLLEHPKVAECAVVGAPDAHRGMIVKAFVVPRPGIRPGDDLARDLQDFVKAQIAPYKYPRAVSFVETLPRTATGKLQRYRLREDHQ
jgi:2-aminobenzoate-CoA ligase